jgi:hypothetical protein
MLVVLRTVSAGRIAGELLRALRRATRVTSVPARRRSRARWDREPA